VTPQFGDVVFTYEATLHRYAMIPDGFRGCLGRRVALVRPDPAKVDGRFLLYYFLSFNWRRIVESAAITGATVDRLPLEKFPEFQVQLPDLKVQRSIADVLSAYDNLIGNNKRRINLLEQSANLLFDEWFVRLRFPGHEHDKRINGIPRDWKREKIRAFCESIDYGYTATADESESGPHYLRITDIVPDSIDWEKVPYCKIDERKKEKFLIRDGDIVVARTGATVGYAKRIARLRHEAVFASYLVRMRPVSAIARVMLGVFMTSGHYKRYVASQIGGAAQPNANAKVLSNAPLLFPSTSIGEAFRRFVEPILDQVAILAEENGKLAEARDLLLPRLMEGRIEV
jgi:type I restriction enzyme S subunit